MTDAQVELRKMTVGADGYVVFRDGEYIGRIYKESGLRWKAVDGAMSWTRRYKTRRNAIAALVKKAQP